MQTSGIRLTILDQLGRSKNVFWDNIVTDITDVTNRYTG